MFSLDRGEEHVLAHSDTRRGTLEPKSDILDLGVYPPNLLSQEQEPGENI